MNYLLVGEDTLCDIISNNIYDLSLVAINSFIYTEFIVKFKLGPKHQSVHSSSRKLIGKELLRYLYHKLT